MIEAIPTTSHPVGISHYTDGHIPSGRYPNPSQSEEKVYLQPAIELQDVAKGAVVKSSDKKSLCQQMAEEHPGEALRDWLIRNKKTLGWIAGGYLVFRIITRRKQQ
ncbi:hypothetical protein LX73_1245 [Fodinibius salinus]|uniref:Uncharacterized protein n=1 Tax=Fodinibius salinus TaxID=860790 RepID=A0A5D3YN13_9BACT|nr:hypothetical protein [Fodinibius salinus]TYP93539.1 hypothetical protein LX73_1245 [Fodinibius salinus]